MANKLTKLIDLLSNTRSKGKVPTARTTSASQRRAFDSFQRTAQAIFQQSMAGSAERSERYKDFDQMDQMPEIAQALNIYADDSSTYDEADRVLDITSDDERIVQALEELFYERIDIEFHLWNWIRNLVKYGDSFLLLDLEDKEGILSVIQMPNIEIEREEAFDGNPNSVRFRWNAQGNTVFENYQVSHMRILGDDRFLPYGRSVLEPARKIWKQLTMAEDAMLIYRFTRAPERRVFYIDVGNIPPKDVDVYMKQSRDALKRNSSMTESNGQIDLRYDSPAIDEDFFLPIRGDRGSRIDTLPGGSNQGDIEDVEYLQNKLFISMGVPKSYLTAEEDLGGKGALAQEDIKFARTIQRIQKIVVSELAKMALIHLFLKGFDEEEIYNFDLMLTNPSTVMEMMQLDLLDKRFTIAETMKQSGMVDQQYIQKKILLLSDSEIAEANSRLIDDARKRGMLERIEQGEEEDPASDNPFDSESDDEKDEEDDEPEDTSAELTDTQKNPTKVPDPTGTKHIPYAPSSEGVIKDEFDIMINLDNKINSIGGNINRKRRIRDTFDRNISDAAKTSAKVKHIFEQLREAKKNDTVRNSIFKL